MDARRIELPAVQRTFVVRVADRPLQAFELQSAQALERNAGRIDGCQDVGEGTVMVIGTPPWWSGGAALGSGS